MQEDGTEVRLRQKGEDRYLTVKSGSGMTRSESEVEIDEGQFALLWGATENKRIGKTRYSLPHEMGTLLVDEYHGKLDGFFSAEMEFSSEEESNKFVPPEWLGEEVTEDKRYKNQNLALYGTTGVVNFSIFDVPFCTKASQGKRFSMGGRFWSKK